MGGRAFCNKSNDWSSPPRDRAGVRLRGGAKFSKSRTSKNALGAPCLLRNHLLSFASHLDGRSTGERGQSVLSNNERLTIAEKSYDFQ